MMQSTKPEQGQMGFSDSGEMESPEFVSVDIYDQTYHLRGHDPAYIRALAERVDSKMRAVASHGKTVDSLRVAVLAALNIADELATLKQKQDAQDSDARRNQNAIRNRANSLNGLLDSVLGDGRRAG
ncbi:cell division protein ZapA [Silvibacterium acidisoli]|uniref:cell division protein ZapA n=1 Tax=Acidobacteriaceae bacterium ZG23-2 TaxID=2883246 RepID=UPI00406CC9C6